MGLGHLRMETIALFIKYFHTFYMTDIRNFTVNRVPALMEFVFWDLDASLYH